MADLRSVGVARLRRTLTAVAAAHPFYRARFRELGVSADDVRSLGDLSALPLTRKEDYISDPEAFRLRPQDLPADCSPEERVLWDIAYTTGTTSGRPSPFYNTAHDAYAIWDQARRCNEAEGLTASDRVANLYPLAGFPTGAFLSVIRSTMIAGLPVVHGLTGSANSEFKVRNSLAEALATVARFRPTVLWGVPSFICRFLDEACRQGADFSDVRLVLSSGEPVGETLRAALRSQLARVGAPSIAIRARYAFTEMQGGLVQCADGAAPQNLVPDLYHLEVVEPDTGRSLGTARAARSQSPICIVAAPCCCAISSATSSRCRARRARSAAARASGWLRLHGAPATWSNAGECWSTPISLLIRSWPWRSSANSRSCLPVPARRIPWSGW
jgi:phenylacetate-CoA ligase